MIRSLRKIEVVDCPLSSSYLGRDLDTCRKCRFFKDLTLEGVNCEYRAKGDV